MATYKVNDTNGRASFIAIVVMISNKRSCMASITLSDYKDQMT